MSHTTVSAKSLRPVIERALEYYKRQREKRNENAINYVMSKRKNFWSSKKYTRLEAIYVLCSEPYKFYHASFEYQLSMNEGPEEDQLEALLKLIAFGGSEIQVDASDVLLLLEIKYEK